MLRKFSVTGYRGFEKRLTFDLTKAHDYEFNNHLIKKGIISSGVIYGINGSGKSSLGFALFDIVGVLTDYELAAPMKDSTSYVNANSPSKEVLFEYEFMFGEEIVNYSYKKTSPEEIKEEKLYIGDKLILRREGECTEYKLNSGIIFPALPSNMSSLRFLYRNTPLPEDNPITRIILFVEKMLWFRSLNNRGYCGYTSGGANLTGELCQQNKVKDFEKFLEDMGGIKMKLEALISPLSGTAELYIKYANRKIEFFKASSTGTQELLLLFYWMTFALKDVKFLFIDEFDAFYHYELAAKIVSELSSRSCLQSFFTSHNTYLASNRIMRPDCFFILSNGQMTSFADATTRELREGHNLEKMFRNGEFDG